MQIMNRLLLLSLLVLVLGLSNGCSNDGTNSTPAGATAANSDKGFYVKEGGSGKKDGTSWTNAFGDLQKAIDAAAAKDSTKKKVYIAVGTYKPTSCPDKPNGECPGGDGSEGDDSESDNSAGDDSDRKKHFALKNNVYVYGGYKKGSDGKYRVVEVDENTQDDDKTILSGDIGTEGVDADNAYHVFYHPAGTNLDATAKLTGVTITKGNASADNGVNASGGGMYNKDSSPTLNLVNFGANKAKKNGGGMYNEGSSPKLTSVTFTHNAASANGGGIANYNASMPSLTNVTFKENRATEAGGGMYNEDASNPNKSMPTLTNVRFKENRATEAGGGMYNEESSPTLTNVTFTGNTATEDGGGMYNHNASMPTLTNVIFKENTAFENGGGMYNDGASNLTLEDCEFTSNTASAGGGIFNHSSSPKLKQITFTSNTATDFGGGMYNEGSSPKLTSVTFKKNKAGSIEKKREGRGGAIYNARSSIQGSPTYGTDEDENKKVIKEGDEYVYERSDLEPMIMKDQTLNL